MREVGELGEEKWRLWRDTHTHTGPAQLVQSAHTCAQSGAMLKCQGEKPERGLKYNGLLSE